MNDLIKKIGGLKVAEYTLSQVKAKIVEKATAYTLICRFLSVLPMI